MNIFSILSGIAVVVLLAGLFLLQKGINLAIDNPHLAPKSKRKWLLGYGFRKPQIFEGNGYKFYMINLILVDCALVAMIIDWVVNR